MINPDILRVMAELFTFTAEELAEALQCPMGTAGAWLFKWHEKRDVVRFKFEKTYLYALSPHNERIAAKLPPVDPGERCLPITFEGICPEPGIASGCCPDWNTSHMECVTLEGSDMLVAWRCPHCDHLFPVAVWNPH